MISYLLYLTLVVFVMLFGAGLAVYMVSLVYSSFKGSPFVGTRLAEAKYILREAKLKPGHVFYELGSGDGRVVCEAVNTYRVRGVGIDINPVLTFAARLQAKLTNAKQVRFHTQNIFAADISEADIVYLFLMPKLISMLLPRLKKQLSKKTLVISHGFEILPWRKKLVKKLIRKPFPTYFYRV